MILIPDKFLLVKVLMLNPRF